MAVKKSAAGNAAAGKKTAAAHRKLQREAERRRERTEATQPKKERAAQLGARKYPELPYPKQHQAKPGKETELEPRPKYKAPEYRGSGKLETRSR